MKIKKVLAREILDSRANPTVEAEVILECGIKARAAAPSGASTGKFEAVELRDGNKNRFLGNGVLKAVDNINNKISKNLEGKDISNIYEIDKIMIELDGTSNKSKLGANAILAVSLASAKAAGKAFNIPLYKFIGGVSANCLPLPMMNILNGGVHASNSLDIQEFMIVPVGSKSFSEGLRWSAEVFHTLKKILKSDNETVAVGDEGGFAPNLKSDEDALERIIAAIELAGFRMREDFMLALDAAASEWKDSKGKGFYLQPKSGNEFRTEDLINHWEYLISKYPIYSIEDGLDEEDWDGWKTMTERLGDEIQLVGDDLFVTNTGRLKKGINSKCANSVLIKPNQIGTLSETIEAVKMAQKAGYRTIISHRSGETEDTAIADIAVGLNAGQIKTGAPSRGERTAKYNRLLRIQEEVNNVFKT